MTSPAFPCTARLAPAVLVSLVLACGDDGGTTATEASSNGSTGSTGGPTTVTPTSGTASETNTDSTVSGMSNSGSETGTTTPSTDTTAETTATVTTVDPDTTDPTNTTRPDTTEPIDTDTSTSSSTTVDPDTSASSSSTTVDPDTGSSTGDDTTGNPIEPCACPDIEVPLDDGIFVLRDSPPQLWKYFPEFNTFENLGAINCAGLTQAFSMAVDRLGFAWVMFSNPNGTIRKIDVTDPANCMDPGYVVGQQGVQYFGMAFVSNSAVDVCDSLYGNTFNGIGGFGEGPNAGNFLNVDPDTLQLSILGPTTFNGAELTGTGDGRAFMFGGVNPTKLVEVNKQNGMYLDVLPLGNTLPLTNAFAFAFFGGDFYFFTESNNPTVSKVTHLDYDDSDMNGMQDLTVINNNAGFRIVGAGVSTCAPFAPQ